MRKLYNLTPYPILYVIALLFWLQATKVIAEDLNYNQNSINGLSQSYGFIIGQSFSLKKISKKYPNLSSSALIAKAKFDSSFPNIESKLKEQLVHAMGEKQFGILDIDIQKQIQSKLESQNITYDTSNEFINQVKERATGRIESPIIEYILSVNYSSSPVQEFTSNYRQRFNTDGHPKAQGIKLSLQLPKSWKAKEGERPHIVQKWMSQNGAGLEMIHLDIRDSDGYTPTNDEIQSFVSTGEIKSSVANNATYLDSGVFSLEMRNGYWLEINSTEERVNKKLYMHSIMYQLFFNKKAIGIMCETSSFIDKKDADDSFKRITPLCQQVLNSLVLLEAY